MKSGTVLKLLPSVLKRFGDDINRVIEYDDGSLVAQRVSNNGDIKKSIPITQQDVLTHLGDELNIGQKLSKAVNLINSNLSQPKPQVKPKTTPKKAFGAGGLN